MTNNKKGLKELPEFSKIKRVDVHDLNLNAEGQAFAHRLEKPAENLKQAAEIFERDGVVALADKCQVETVDEQGKKRQLSVLELTTTSAASTIAKLQSIWDSADRETIIKAKDYGAYNGTERHMCTVSFENVQAHLPDVIELQHSLLPTIRDITADSSVEISDDPDEGTVVNLQLFNKDAPAGTRQEHGAHTDRVDITTVVCLDNVGPQGDFVYLKGYNDACRALSLDPHRDFLPNMGRILKETPEAVIFRIYPVKPGRMLVARTDQDVHFITAKSRGDVELGIKAGAKVSVLGDKILGRGIINAAFETARCRRIFEHSKEVYSKNNDLTKLRGDDYFQALDLAIKTEVAAGRLPKHELEDMRNACVTQMSAAQLYND